MNRKTFRALAIAGQFPGETYAPPTWRQNLAAFGISLIAAGSCAALFLVRPW